MNITNDIVTEYLTGFYRPVNEELAALRQMGEKDRVPIILRETEMYLHTLRLFRAVLCGYVPEGRNLYH